MSTVNTEFLALKGVWIQVLDALLEQDRIAWLAFFDARLVGLEAEVLTIGFDDSKKFAGDHDFSLARNPKHLNLLIGCIKEISGRDLSVVEK